MNKESNKQLAKSNEEINRLTRQSIQEALVTLLSKKDIKDISVTEIVNKAGVSRSAYYRNYQSKEDILKDFVGNVFSLFFNRLSTEEMVNAPEEWYRLIFTTVKKNERINRLLFNANLSDYVQFLPQIDEENYDRKEQYEVYAMESALLSVVQMWVKNDFDLTVDEISAMCFELFPHIGYIVKRRHS